MKRSDVEQVLLKIGIPASILGFTYITDAVMVLDKYGEEKTKITIVYQMIGKKRNATGSRVERAIRHALEVARECGNHEVVEHYIGFTHKENSASLYQLLLAMKSDSCSTKAM